MMGSIDVSKYAQFPVHTAIATRDHAALRKILSGLPRLSDPAKIRSETAALAEEEKVDAISTVVDRRDNVPNRDTPLHLAVKLCDETAVKMLMIAGADSSLQNEQGWSALQEAICNRQETIAKIILRHHVPLAWAKWCRRLPRLVATLRRMKDFYMEITFHFESSVIPFISKIAPSDTYKIWKIGANLRADMTLAGFDGFRIQRSERSILFLGEGSKDGKLPPGQLCIISHKDKEIMNVLNDNDSTRESEVEVQQEVAFLLQTNISRPGMDVTEAVLLPKLTWRGLEKMETVGQWKAKVYEMHNVVLSLKSRKVPGAMFDGEHFSSCNDNKTNNEEHIEILSEEERKKLEHALKLDSYDGTNVEGGDVLIGHRHSCYKYREIPVEDVNGCKNAESNNEKKGWFGDWRKQDQKREEGSRCKVGSQENEYKKGLIRPILWLSPNFPLRTEELLPLLDILANKVKAIRRLRELLTTKLPPGTFPVKVAIPIVPTIRVLVTFTKFEELQPIEEFSTPPSSPTSTSYETSPVTTYSSSSSSSASDSSSSKGAENTLDPFAIPADYVWTSDYVKEEKMQEKSNTKNGRRHANLERYR